MAAPVMVGVVLWRYHNVSAYVKPLNIDTDVMLSYTLNLFAIGLGALISLFALLASRPTDFLNRIRGTQTFRSLIDNIKITMLFCAVVILVNFIFGVLKLAPEAVLTLGTVIFVMWLALAAATGAFFINTVRLIFLALT
jgi:hypothetical protein